VVADQQAHWHQGLGLAGEGGETLRRRVLRILLAARLVLPLSVLVVCVGLVAVLAAGMLGGWAPPRSLGGVMLLAAAVALAALAVVAIRLRSQLLRPLASLEASVSNVCQGVPGAAATLPVESSRVLGPVARDIGSLSEELTDLYEDMDNRVARQTRRLAQKTASLKILYDVANSINQAQNLEDLLIGFLRSLKEMVNGRAATVRLRMPDGRMRLVACIGLDDEMMVGEDILPIRLCQCGRALSPGDVLCENDPAQCTRLGGRRMFGPDEVEMVEVPLAYHEDVLGVYQIYVVRPGISGREDVMDLLTTIGSHLGVAVAKQRSDAEARRLSIIEERTALAHELHDSLAQTLASLRFQVRMLAETLEQEGSREEALEETSRIRNGLDEAHTELRELLNSFRMPLDRRGLIPALEKLVGRFRQEAGIPIFLQCDCRQVELSASEEMQMVRIVQEALTNIRKHARAQTVRVLVRCKSAGDYALLVEDDGVGFEETPPGGRPGEHIGLSIMQERARRLGGHLRIESEPGEGTRVELSFRPADRLADAPEVEAL
jgi:two-component system nitrate/nitrite sensor histidine kinase NarX